MTTEDGWTLRSNCDEGCTFRHVDGDVYDPPISTIASPGGTTYSVHHQLGGFLDPGQPDLLTCLLFFQPDLPGAPDDIVTFNGVAEAIRTDILYTVPTVIETDIAQPDGRRLIRINTSSPGGTDLFPGNIEYGGFPLTHACFTIGIDDPLDWEGLDVVTRAEITFLVDNVPAVGPADITSLFIVPWDGFLSVTLEDGTGNGFNGVRLEMLVGKSVELTNDDCVDRKVVTDGTIPYTNIGATTDGNEEDICLLGGYGDIGSDVWFAYNATCTGTLTVNLCGSDFDTKVAVYGGCGRCPPDHGPLGCNDDVCGFQSVLSVPVAADDCYTIRVGGFLGFQGSGAMTITCDVIGPPTGACCLGNECVGTLNEADCLTQSGAWFVDETCPEFSCPVSPPSNDECEDCIRVLTGTPTTGSSVGATGTDITADPCGDTDTKDVWHCWTADCTGLATFDTAGSLYDTTLAIFDDCGGTELVCNDDFVTLQARAALAVTEGTSYRIRVSGHQGAVGDYQLLVSTCKNACCAPPGPGVYFGCAMGTPAQCAAAEGTMRPPGSICLGDGDGNLIDDACEPCPVATITDAAPDDGTIDARQPHAGDAALPRQGIGSPGDPGSQPEPILVLLIPRLAQVESCFSLCETEPDPVEGANFITEVTDLGRGIYEIILDHAIAAGGVTTIEYTGDGSFVEYTSHPANSDAGVRANAYDIPELIDCCLDGECIPMWGIHSCDIDHSSRISPLDILTAADLLNGAGEFVSWDGSLRPANDGVCP